MESTSASKIVNSRKQQQKLELNLRGLRLEKEALDSLRSARIYAQTSVSLEHQILAKRYVIRAVESGGANRSLGHFVGFATPQGEALPWLTPLDAIAPNGLHAIVIAPALVRFEMFRFGRNYRLSITRHTIQQVPGKRPRLVSTRVLLSHQGYLALDLADKENRILAGQIAPQFFDRAGEEISIPDPFSRWIKALASAVSCVDCRHTHFALAPSVIVSPEASVTSEQIDAAAVA